MQKLMWPFLILWPLFAVITAGLVVLGPVAFYTTGWIVLVALPLLMLWIARRTHQTRTRKCFATLWLVIGTALAVFGLPSKQREYQLATLSFKRTVFETAGRGLEMAWETYCIDKRRAPHNLEELVDSVPVSQSDLFPFSGAKYIGDITRRNRPTDLSTKCAFVYCGSNVKLAAKGQDHVLFYMRETIDGLGAAVVFKGGEVHWVSRDDLDNLLVKIKQAATNPTGHSAN